MQQDILIEGRGVSKVFKDFWGRPKVRAVNSVDITVRRGTVFGLLGPNGAGKSTLMKMLLGHLYPTAGTLTVMGKHPSDVDAKAQIGYMPEKTTLYRHLTPMQTLKFFGQILELPSDTIQSRSEQLLEMVGLSHAKDRIVGEFSHGMGRRMGLAQALLNDPDLLLLDEPTAGLDPLGCREVKDLILTLGKRGKTIVLTSHLLADVEEVSDELMIIYGGKVQAVGKAQELLAHKDILQVTIPDAGAGMKEAVLKAVSGTVSPDQVDFSNPTRSLENYFLDVVREAGSRQETYGARAGKGVASYLRDVAESQTQPEQVPEKAEETSPAEAEEPTTTNMLDDEPDKGEEKEASMAKQQEPQEPEKDNDVEPAPISAEQSGEADAAPDTKPVDTPASEPEDDAFDTIRVTSGNETKGEPVESDKSPVADDDDDDVDHDLLDSLTK